MIYQLRTFECLVLMPQVSDSIPVTTTARGPTKEVMFYLDLASTLPIGSLYQQSSHIIRPRCRTTVGQQIVVAWTLCPSP
jgi:hypothetical protein